MAHADWYEPDQIYWCALCNQQIEHAGYDPCKVDVEAHRGNANGGTWLFWAHALCVRDAFHPEFAHDIPREEYMPRATEPS